MFFHPFRAILTLRTTKGDLIHNGDLGIAEELRVEIFPKSSCLQPTKAGKNWSTQTTQEYPSSISVKQSLISACEQKKSEIVFGSQSEPCCTGPQEKNIQLLVPF